MYHVVSATFKISNDLVSVTTQCGTCHTFGWFRWFSAESYPYFITVLTIVFKTVTLKENFIMEISKHQYYKGNDFGTMVVENIKYEKSQPLIDC